MGFWTATVNAFTACIFIVTFKIFIIGYRFNALSMGAFALGLILSCCFFSGQILRISFQRPLRDSCAKAVLRSR